MKETIEVRHSCGCRRRYPFWAGPEVVSRIVTQLEGQACGQAECPRKAIGRLTASAATAHVNGKGEV